MESDQYLPRLPHPELKMNGIHKYVRHPLYSGTILFVAGLFFIFPTLSNLIAAGLLIGYILIGITFEEKKLKKEFGKAYIQYMYESAKAHSFFLELKKVKRGRTQTKVYLTNEIPGWRYGFDIAFAGRR